MSLDNQPPRLLTISEVINRTTCRKTNLYERIKAGEFHPIKLGRKTVFSSHEIDAWIKAHIANGGAAAINACIHAESCSCKGVAS